MIKKYAWLPKKVKTWRRSPTYAIIWLQPFFKTDEHCYCLKIGRFSKEL